MAIVEFTLSLICTKGCQLINATDSVVKVVKWVYVR